MPAMRPARPERCNSLALRQAARHVGQLYDQCLATYGLRTGQFGILAQLVRRGPLTINALAGFLVMDRTTLGRNVRPLERDGLIAVATAAADRRSRELRLTPAGEALFARARIGWDEAQARFERSFGDTRAGALRDMLHAVVTTDLAAQPPDGGA